MSRRDVDGAGDAGTAAGAGQATIIGMWLREAPTDEVVLACAEEAYTLRELITAIHRTGNASTHPARNTGAEPAGAGAMTRLTFPEPAADLLARSHEILAGSIRGSRPGRS